MKYKEESEIEITLRVESTRGCGQRSKWHDGIRGPRVKDKSQRSCYNGGEILSSKIIIREIHGSS